MKRLKTFILFCWFVAAFHWTTLGDDGKDHLSLVNLHEGSRYRAIWNSKLNVTPFNCGRVTVRPYSEPEFSVSVYSCDAGNGRRVYAASYVTADDNLYQRTDGGHYPEKAASIKTHCADADIPQETAELLRRVWLRMLKDAHGQVPPPMKEWEIMPGDDTTDVEFSLQRDGAISPLPGQVNLWLKTQRPKTKAFLNLAKMVVDYAKAKPPDRPRMLHTINRNAADLLRQ
jgi:hypothetical protein